MYEALWKITISVGTAGGGIQVYSALQGKMTVSRVQYEQTKAEVGPLGVSGITVVHMQPL